MTINLNKIDRITFERTQKPEPWKMTLDRRGKHRWLMVMVDPNHEAARGFVKTRDIPKLCVDLAAKPEPEPLEMEKP